ncbi:MAG: gamma-glutamyltransferase, partial [Alkalibacterium sp.]|nr:gamma-glutamyltransferase [Alkalibacterium sp.]
MKYVKLFVSVLLLLVLLMLFLLLPGYLASNKQDEGAASEFRNYIENMIPGRRQPKQTTAQEDTKDKEYGVSTSSTYATEIGEKVLKEGGNAVDAAVAVSYALAVTEPYASGLGGGGGMMIYDPDEDQYHGLNYRDSAPISQSTMEEPTGVPTFVRGMEEASQSYGTIPMEKLIEPTIQLGEKGFEVSSVFSTYINIYDYFLADNSDYLDEKGDLLSEGETMQPKNMIETLKKIRDEGADAYYSGEIADEIVDKTWLTYKDLQSARVEDVEPVVTSINDNEYATLPAPFSGVTLIQMLKLAERMDLPDPQQQTDDYLEKYSRLKQLAYKDRVSNMGDPDFDDIDSQEMVEDSYIDNLADSSQEIVQPGETEVDSTNTTHFSIIDSEGMVVSATSTLGNFYGSEIEAGGFYLNAANRLFAKSDKGKNKYEAGKKPRNFTAPTIIQTSDQDAIAIGTPGGNMIPQFLFQVINDYFSYQTDLAEAVEQNRIYLDKEEHLLIEENPERNDRIPVKSIGDIPFSFRNSDEYFGSVQIVEKEKGGNVHGSYD